MEKLTGKIEYHNFVAWGEPLVTSNYATTDKAIDVMCEILRALGWDDDCIGFALKNGINIQLRYRVQGD